MVPSPGFDQYLAWETSPTRAPLPEELPDPPLSDRTPRALPCRALKSSASLRVPPLLRVPVLQTSAPALVRATSSGILRHISFGLTAGS